MTSEGLGEMFEGDSADMCARKFPLMLMGGEQTVQRAQTVSEDPHRREWKSFTVSNAFGWRGHVMKVYKYDSTLSRKVQGLNNMQHILKSFNQKCNCR